MQLGKMLANTMKYAFFDTDSMLEKTLDMPVSSIFKEYGEDYFRECEAQVLKQLAPYKNLVVATGGGAVIRPMNWSYLHSGGQCVHVHSTALCCMLHAEAMHMSCPCCMMRLLKGSTAIMALPKSQRLHLSSLSSLALVAPQHASPSPSTMSRCFPPLTRVSNISKHTRTHTCRDALARICPLTLPPP